MTPKARFWRSGLRTITALFALGGLLRLAVQ